MSSTAGRYSSTRPEAELFWACSVELSISKQSALQPAELASPQLDRAAPAVELFVSDRAAKVQSLQHMWSDCAQLNWTELGFQSVTRSSEKAQGE